MHFIHISLIVLGLFAAAIFVHELGHFLVARWCGLVVEEFALGFGKIVWSIKRGTTLYSLRIIPAGGFVKLPQMSNPSMIEGATENNLPQARPLHRILVAFAGPAANIVFAFALATLLWYTGIPKLVDPPVVGELDKSEPAYLAGLRSGDTLLSINQQAVETWDDVTKNAILAPTSDLEVTALRASTKLNLKLQATYYPELGVKALLLPQQRPLVVGDVEVTGAGAKAGLKTGDVLVSIAGKTLRSTMELKRTLAANITVPLVVKRNSESLTLTVTPAKGMLGIGFQDGPQIYKMGYAGSPWTQVSQNFNEVFSTLKALVTPAAHVKPNALSGPVGIIGVIAMKVQTHILLAIGFLVMLNINLAVINLLPLPILDGGHITFAALQGLFGWVLPRKLYDGLAVGFAVLLLGFLVYVSYFDIAHRIGNIKDNMAQKVEISK